MRPETALRSRNRSVALNSDFEDLQQKVSLHLTQERQDEKKKNKEALEKARKKLEQDINKFLYQKVHSLSRSLLWVFCLLSL